MGQSLSISRAVDPKRLDAISKTRKAKIEAIVKRSELQLRLARVDSETTFAKDKILRTLFACVIAHTGSNGSARLRAFFNFQSLELALSLLRSFSVICVNNMSLCTYVMLP